MTTPSSGSKINSSKLLQGLVVLVGKHGCGSSWQFLASSNAKKYSFLSQEPSEREGAIKRNDRLIRLQSLHEDGLALEWMAADAGAVDSRGYVLIGNNRWVLRNISIFGGGHFRYCGDLPFGLLWSSSFEHAQLLLGNDHTGPPKSKDARVTFFLADGRSVEIVYEANLRTIAQINVGFVGSSVPCI